jgi:hypothetical protein
LGIFSLFSVIKILAGLKSKCAIPREEEGEGKEEERIEEKGGGGQQEKGEERKSVVRRAEERRGEGKRRRGEERKGRRGGKRIDSIHRTRKQNTKIHYESSKYKNIEYLNIL